MLCEAIEALKPEGAQDIRVGPRRGYLILKEQFLCRKPVFVVEDMVGFERSAYHLEQARALERLGALLYEWESQAQREEPRRHGPALPTHRAIRLVAHIARHLPAAVGGQAGTPQVVAM